MGNANGNVDGSYLLYRNSNKAIWNYWINGIVKFFIQDKMNFEHAARYCCQQCSSMSDSNRWN
jgi:hypothetical protein